MYLYTSSQQRQVPALFGVLVEEHPPGEGRLEVMLTLGVLCCLSGALCAPPTNNHHHPRQARMYRERFLMVRQRVHRHDLFRPPIIESSRREYIKLSPLDSLVSYTSCICMPCRAVMQCFCNVPVCIAVAVDIAAVYCCSSCFWLVLLFFFKLHYTALHCSNVNVRLVIRHHVRCQVHVRKMW